MTDHLYRAQELEKRLAPTGMIHRVVELPETDSTNLRLKEGDYPPGTLLFTLNQHHGRGRLGREWSAPAGSCLAMSVLLPPSLLDETTRPLLPLCAALAVREGLKQACGRDDFLIKWPNDIICSGLKICGILCEHSFFDQQERTVCGMGINLSQSKEDFVRATLPHAGSLAMLCDAPPPAEKVAAAVCSALAGILKQLQKSGATALLRAYAAYSATLGRQVRIVNGKEDFTGLADSLTSDGSLVVQTADGMRTVCAGEVSVRGLYGYLPDSPNRA